MYVRTFVCLCGGSGLLCSLADAPVSPGGFVVRLGWGGEPGNPPRWSLSVLARSLCEAAGSDSYGLYATYGLYGATRPSSLLSASVRWPFVDAHFEWRGLVPSCSVLHRPILASQIQDWAVPIVVRRCEHNCPSLRPSRYF